MTYTDWLWWKLGLFALACFLAPIIYTVVTRGRSLREDLEERDRQQSGKTGPGGPQR